MNKQRRIDSTNNTLPSSTTSTTKSSESMDDNTSSKIQIDGIIDNPQQVQPIIVLEWYNRQLHQCKIVDRKININNISYLIHYEGW